MNKEALEELILNVNSRTGNALNLKVKIVNIV